MPSDRDSFRRNRVAPVGPFRIAPLRVASKFPRAKRAHNTLFLWEITGRELGYKVPVTYAVSRRIGLAVLARQQRNQRRILGARRAQRFAASIFVVGQIEPRRHRRPQQREFSARREPRSLPRPAGHSVL
jgi:hypothetical protein